ncbi:DUF7144 family membrane protein [Nocardia bhagyanarayanae]|uniref:DUF7144 domain-containing protein n=1 Tax=Nocardia bhagyanarayanae TaxID=1215925 RepID=A0A543FGW2_9NOCA|nr:hypothetical protein [Nocardia bhagyanarayanae]TQM32984.1 hypothetical protein FB390_4697 [Nocardia bhagyanarayanae]
MTRPTETNDVPVSQAVAAGTSIGAAFLLMITGIVSILQGISAIAKDEIYVTGPEYIYQFNTTGWGWVHLILGILLVLASLGLMAGAAWARVVAVIVAGLSLLGNFLWLPYYPWWSVLVIALDVVVIWAVTTWQPNRL